MSFGETDAGRKAAAAGGGLAAGIASGLIGLGGAEFRLPLLSGLLAVPLRHAVPLNLAVSLCVVLAALPLRLLQTDALPPQQFLPVAIAIAIGAMLAAFKGAQLLLQLRADRLAFLVKGLLASLGILMLIEAVLPMTMIGLLTGHPLTELTGGLLIGLVIGLVSSLLGVAGGELIIPTLVIGYGVPVKAAGTLSILISVPAMTVGILRYWRLGGFRTSSMEVFFKPMAAGSIVGAFAGAAMIGLVPAHALKVTLGILLIWSAWHAVPVRSAGKPTGS